MDIHSILIVSCFLDSFTWSGCHIGYCLRNIQLKAAKKVLFDHTCRNSSIKVSHITNKVKYIHSFNSTLFVQTSSIVLLYTVPASSLSASYAEQNFSMMNWKYIPWKYGRCFLSNINHNGISVIVYIVPCTIYMRLIIFIYSLIYVYLLVHICLANGRRGARLQPKTLPATHFFLLLSVLVNLFGSDVCICFS